MALAVDAINRHGPSNEMRHQLQPKKTKVRLHKPFIHIALKDVLPVFVANKTECFSFKSGCAIGVENV